MNGRAGATGSRPRPAAIIACAALAAACLPRAAAGWASSLEAASRGASDLFLQAPARALSSLPEVSEAAAPALPEEGPVPAVEGLPVQPAGAAQPEAMGPPVQVPVLRPVGQDNLGPLLADFALADRLDVHRNLVARRFGRLDWDLSLAADPALQTNYLTFARGNEVVLQRVKDPNQAGGDGVVARIDKDTAYRFKVTINIFNPVRGSAISMDPVEGTQGPAHRMTTGELLDAIQAKSVVLKAGRKELWLLYATDVDPAADRFASTRSIVFLYQAGMGSKAWPVAEAALQPGQAYAVDLNDTPLTLIRTLDGRLRVHSGAGIAAPNFAAPAPGR